MSVTFKSVFKKEFEDLVALKRSLGFKYEATEKELKRLDRFFVEQELSEKRLTKEICEIWMKKRSYESVMNQHHRASALRVFSSYLNDIGIPAYVPPKGCCGKKVRYDAHIYSDDELKRFFKAVDQCQSVPSECPYRAKVLPLFFRILYSSGLRVSELRLIRLKDFDLDKGYLTLKETKNNKERLVPVHPELVNKCRKLKEEIHQNSPEDEYFFMIRPGEPMSLSNLYRNFRRFLEKAGISHTGRGPRIHDFRHTYCVNLLKSWAEQGKDLMAYLPYMKTMLGHAGFEETAYYLKLTRERFPYIKEVLEQAYPDLLEQVVPDDKEFY